MQQAAREAQSGCPTSVSVPNQYGSGVKFAGKRFQIVFRRSISCVIRSKRRVSRDVHAAFDYDFSTRRRKSA